MTNEESKEVMRRLCWRIFGTPEGEFITGAFKGSLLDHVSWRRNSSESRSWQAIGENDHSSLPSNKLHREKKNPQKA